ncbi:barstar family protein [Kitasatospora sp. NPDC051984]|uniref:barstar family protein n=1 Tax=Kitasatospora sp. NPDC051984 TaxID=3364059 RepID=UPI0037C51BA6
MGHDRPRRIRRRQNRPLHGPARGGDALSAPGVTLVDPSAIGRAAAARDAVLRYRVDTAAAASRADFFDAVRGALPMDPPLLGRRGWDALADSLWSGLHGAPGDTALIVVTDLTLLHDRAPGEFRTAVGILTELADTLTDPSFTGGRPTSLHCLIGLRGAAG